MSELAKQGGRQLALIALFAVLVACVPLFTRSGTVLNFVMMALYATLIAQAARVRVAVHARAPNKPSGLNSTTAMKITKMPICPSDSPR